MYNLFITSNRRKYEVFEIQQTSSATATHMPHLTHAEDRSTCIVSHASAAQVPCGIIRTTPKPDDLQSQWGSTVMFESVKGL